MGRFNKTNLYYISAGLIIGLGIYAFMSFGGLSPNFLLSTSAKGEAHARVDKNGNLITSTIPKASWKALEAGSNTASEYDSDYQAASGYANDYVAPEEENHPLIASAKFIKKKNKNKDKKKKDKKSTSLADKKGKDSSDERNGLSESEDPSSNPNYLTGSGPIAGAPGPAINNDKKKKAEEEEENLNTVEFWEKPIFIDEDPTAVRKLVDNYQIKKVSGNVFYTVVSEMNHDERPQIRTLGIDALASTPSAKSFTQLTWVKHNDTEADLRNLAITQLTGYTDVSRLNYVVSTLGMNKDQNVSIEALRTLTSSTVRYSELSAQQQASPQQTAATYSQLEPRYTQALEIIEQNHAQSTNATIKAEATKTVEALNKFMSI